MDGGGAADVACVGAIDANVALAKVGVFVEDHHVDVSIQPELQVGLGLRQIGQEAVQGMFGEPTPPQIEMDRERVRLHRLPVEGAVLNPLLAKGHVQPVVELGAGPGHEGQRAKDEECPKMEVRKPWHHAKGKVRPGQGL